MDLSTRPARSWEPVLSRPAKHRRIWIDPQDFVDLRKSLGMTREHVAQALNVSRRTVQNWEAGGTGPRPKRSATPKPAKRGTRIPWMAYRMLRLLGGTALPGIQWEGWTVRGGVLYSPAGRGFDAAWLMLNEHVFAQARLWRQMYAASGRARTASTVVEFPERRRGLDLPQNTPQGGLKRKDGTR